MNMERNYVSEEKYNKAIKLLKRIRIILLVLGVVILIGGIILLVLGFQNDSSKSSSEYPWMNEPSKSDFPSFNLGMIMGGGVMIGFGLMLTFAGGVMLSLIIHRREITGFMVMQSEPVVREGYHAYKETIQAAIYDSAATINSAKGESAEDPDKDHKFCKYCGNVLENDAVFCEFCGKKLI